MANVGKVDLLPNSSDMEDSGTSEVGIAGSGYIWSACEAGLEEESMQSIAPIPVEKINEFFHNAHGYLDESNQDVICFPTSGELIPDSESVGFDDGDGDDYKNSAEFEKEVEATFRRALTGVNQDNVIIEINSLRLSYNMSHADCAGALFYSILKTLYDSPHLSQKKLRSTTEKEIKWIDLLKYYLKTKDEEIEVIMKLEEMCLESMTELSPSFTAILNVLYEKDIISEDAILTWANEKEGADESDKIFVKQAEPFITWLREAEEEDDEEE